MSYPISTYAETYGAEADTALERLKSKPASIKQQVELQIAQSEKRLEDLKRMKQLLDENPLFEEGITLFRHF